MLSQRSDVRLMKTACVLTLVTLAFFSSAWVK
jgi:hypothetical protein